MYNYFIYKTSVAVTRCLVSEDIFPSTALVGHSSRNMTSHLYCVIWQKSLLQDLFLFSYITDTKGIFSVSPEECDILPLKTASFRLTFRPVSNFILSYP